MFLSLNQTSLKSLEYFPNISVSPSEQPVQLNWDNLQQQSKITKNKFIFDRLVQEGSKSYFIVLGIQFEDECYLKDEKVDKSIISINESNSKLYKYYQNKYKFNFDKLNPLFSTQAFTHSPKKLRVKRRSKSKL